MPSARWISPSCSAATARVSRSAPDQARAARDALAATVAWVGDELGLHLRGAMVSVADDPGRRARRQGGAFRGLAGRRLRDVLGRRPRLGRTADEERARWPDRRHRPDARPDLTGLSCRFQDIEAANGVILSLIVRPAKASRRGRDFLAVLAEILALAAARAPRRPPRARPRARSCSGRRRASTWRPASSDSAAGRWWRANSPWPAAPC